jgi:sRNA-binding protein
MDEETFAAAAAVPGAMTQPEEQGAKPMELDGGEGGALTQDEQEQWDRSELARAAELGKEMAEKLTAAKEEAAAKAASQTGGSPGKARTPKDEKAARRATSRSPYRKKEGEEDEDPPSLATVREEADHKKIPTDDEGEDGVEPEETEPQEPEESPPQDGE